MDNPIREEEIKTYDEIHRDNRRRKTERDAGSESRSSEWVEELEAARSNLSDIRKVLAPILSEDAWKKMNDADEVIMKIVDTCRRCSSTKKLTCRDENQ